MKLTSIFANLDPDAIAGFQVHADLTPLQLADAYSAVIISGQQSILSDTDLRNAAVLRNAGLCPTLNRYFYPRNH